MRGLLIEGDFLLARTYWGISEETFRVKGLVVSSIVCSEPATLNSFAQSINLGYDGSILYARNSIEGLPLSRGRTTSLLDPHMWGYMRVLVYKEDPLLELMDCKDGTLPVLWVEGDINVAAPP